MFVTGPNVIKTVTYEDVKHEELGGAITHDTKSGVAHFAIDDEEGCLAGVRASSPTYPRTTSRYRRAVETGDPAAPVDHPLRRSSPPTLEAVRRAEEISAVVDAADFIEVHAQFAQNILVGFAQLDGRRSGSSATTPCTWLASSTSTPPQGRAVRPLLRRLQHPARHVR